MRHTSDDRARIVAWVMALPAIVTMLAVSGVEIGRIARPTASLYAMRRTTPQVFAEAIAAQDLLRTYELLRAGHDPNEPITVRDPVLTGGASMDVAPLLWAVATESNQVVPLLLSFGADLEPAARARAICLARRLGNDEVTLVLEQARKDAPGSCPPREANEPAVAWLMEAD